MPTSGLPINSNINYSVLKNELLLNPAALVDANGITLTQHAQAGNYQDCATLLNNPTSTLIPTAILPVALFQSRIVGPELMALSQSQRADLNAFLSEYQTLYGGIPLNDPGTWNSVIPAFFPETAPLYPGYTQNTNQELSSLKQKNATRAEILFQLGTHITWQDIAQAWNWT